IRGAVVWVGLPDPIECSATKDLEVDPERTAHVRALQGWLELDPKGRGLTAAEVLSRLSGRQKLSHLYEALAELCPGQDGAGPNPKSIGGKLRNLIGVYRDVHTENGVEPLAFQRAADASGGLARWCVKKGNHS